MDWNLRPGETELVGELLDTGNRWELDAVAARIDWLTDGALVEVGTRPEDAATLYLDLRDGRYWERTYPRPELPRGGPPRLAVASDVAVRRYGVGKR